VSRLLDVNEPESGGLFVGDLTLHLIRRTGEAILPVLPDLLRAFVTRLASAVTMTFTQSLVLPFAYLIHTQLDTVISLVESIQVNDRSALEVLLSAWTSCHPTIQGYWNTRIS
jgi:importin-9